MARMKDPYLAGWNAAIEAAAGKMEEHGYLVRASQIRALAKPEPIPDDHWRRVNDGDWDYDPPVRRPVND